MIIDTTLQELIDKFLLEDNQKREASHTSSGKLSASFLYQPTRYQVMKNIGIPRKQPDNYVLGLFKRGRDVEDYAIEQLKRGKLLVKGTSQKELEYQKVVGKVDAVIDTDKMQARKGIIPCEVKSVKNAKLARINKAGLDYHYKLQGALYGLAMETEYYAICVISAEDLRTKTYILPTREMKMDINTIITKYNKAMKEWKTKQVLPKLEALPQVKWALNPNYAPFAVRFLGMSDKAVVNYLTKANGVL